MVALYSKCQGSGSDRLSAKPPNRSVVSGLEAIRTAPFIGTEEPEAAEMTLLLCAWSAETETTMNSQQKSSLERQLQMRQQGLELLSSVPTESPRRGRLQAHSICNQVLERF